MKPKKMTIREKLAMMKEIDERNKRRWEAFKNMTDEQKKARDMELLDKYLDGEITKEELYKRIKE